MIFWPPTSKSARYELASSRHGEFARGGADAHDSGDVDGYGPACGYDLAADALCLSARLPFGAEAGEPHAPF